MKKFFATIATILLWVGIAYAGNSNLVVHKGVDNPSYSVGIFEDYNTGHNILMVNGYIDKGLTDLVTQVLDMHPEITTIGFNSPGGSVEGFELGDLIAQRHLTTYVPVGDYCLSSCAYAFIGGEQYIIDGVVGFHHAYIPQFPQAASLYYIFTSGVMDGQMETEYCVRHGFTFQFIRTITMKTNPDLFLSFVNSNDLNNWRDDNMFAKHVDGDVYFSGKYALEYGKQQVEARVRMPNLIPVEIWLAQVKGMF